MEEASSHVGYGDGWYMVGLALLSGWFSIILGGLIAGKSGTDLSEYLKWSIICLLLTPLLGIGYIMACCIAWKSKKMSNGEN